ncbi:MAG TPA: XdhC family protein [Miltoncostaea sp.]|nr:XdhC family protein [Miltoncostaea sp.]
MTTDVMEMARERRLRGEPCVLATVVWRRAPSSGKAGAKALIGPDGAVDGWLGGACAEPAVVREALHALDDGAPRLMFLGPADELEGRRRDGMVSVPIACQSEGALEVYLEPMFPTPHLVAVGRSPAAQALAGIAAALGWRASAVDDADLAATGAGPGSYVVVATQGHYDEEALEQALATGAAYVGLVASRARAEAILGYLRQRGVPEEDLARVYAPAGLDLGRIPPEEIAVAIAGEIVRLRAEGALRPAAAAAAEPETAVDPVCGMTVTVATSRHRLERDGEVAHFCCAGCMAAFETGAQHG